MTMHANDDKHEQQARKPYEKPQIKRFPLRPEEAVLGNCKTAGGSGPSSIGCFSGGFCKTRGS
jgi:hypothetical protein